MTMTRVTPSKQMPNPVNDMYVSLLTLSLAGYSSKTLYISIPLLLDLLCIKLEKGFGLMTMYTDKHHYRAECSPKIALTLLMFYLFKTYRKLDLLLHVETSGGTVLVCALCSLNVHGNSTGMQGICHYTCNVIINFLHGLQVDALVVEFLNMIFIINFMSVEYEYTFAFLFCTCVILL